MQFFGGCRRRELPRPVGRQQVANQGSRNTMSQLRLFFMLSRLAGIGGLCPPNPLGFIALSLLQQKERNKAGRLESNHPALLLLAGFRRRSGCVPAEPYPPLKRPNCAALGHNGQPLNSVQTHYSGLARTLSPVLLAHSPLLRAQTCPVLLAPRQEARRESARRIGLGRSPGSR
jgi:hypothetical protein